jgi:hypothetical protein
MKYLELIILSKWKTCTLKTKQYGWKNERNLNNPCHLIGRFNMANMSIIPKVIYRLNTIPVIYQYLCFTEIQKPISKFVWNWKGPQIVKIILKNEVITHVLPDFEI